MQDKCDVQTCDRGVQADGNGGTPAFSELHALRCLIQCVLTTTMPSEWERLKRLQPFEYLPFTKKINWKRVRALNLDKMVRERGGLC